ncbi:hypothetical protein D3C71_935330 [compost metagenome]
MDKKESASFHAVIDIIGINPFVYVPELILENLFRASGKDKGPIPIRGLINGKEYKQTLMKYSGHWRLYINTQMLVNSPKRIGETVELSVAFDPEERKVEMHPKLAEALRGNPEANGIFESLTPSHKLEIVRYIANLKTEASVEKNVEKAINYLLGKERFVGRSMTN